MKSLSKRGPGRTTAIVALLTLAFAGLAIVLLRLNSIAGAGTLADHDSRAWKATESLHQRFGDEPITILITARPKHCPGGRDCHLTDLVLTPDLLRVLSLEGCLSGNVPRGAKPPAAVCRRFAQTKPFAAVEGPGTFINESARQVTARVRADQASTARKAEQAARAARRIAAAQGLGKVEQKRLARRARELAYLNSLQPALRYGLSPRSPQSIDARFVHQLVFDASLGFDMPKTRFSRLFPNRDSAQILVRLRPRLSPAERRSAISLLQEAVASPSFRLDSASYLVAGYPVTSEAVAAEISSTLVGLALLALLAAAVALTLVFRSRLRLLPLLPVLIGAALSFGILSLTGGALSIASIAVVPVLVALAGSHGAFFQSRFEAEDHRQRGGGGSLIAAALVTVIALLALVFSPAPMVRSFGALVALGVGFSLLLATMVLPAVLEGRQWRAHVGTRTRSWSLAQAAPPLRRAWQGALRGTVRRPRLVLALAALAAILGWVLQGEIGVASRLERLAPNDVGAVNDLKQVQRETDTAGDIDVLVSAQDVTAPGVIAWMSSYERRVLARHGYSEKRPCKAAELCPASSLTSLLGEVPKSNQQATRLVSALPPSFTQGILSPDHRSTIMSFGLRTMSEGKQNAVVRDLGRQLDPPAGVTAALAGRPALTESTDGNLKASGRVVTLVALAAAFLVLLAFHQSWSWAALTLIPLALTTGWSSLVLLIVGFPINPISAALGGLVVALASQLALFASTRYRDERAAGNAPAEAVERSFELSGNTFVTAAAVMLAGLVVLLVSDVRMLREFGIDSLATLFVAITGLALVLPATFVLYEEGSLGFARQLARPAGAARLAVKGARLGRALRRRGEAQRP